MVALQEPQPRMTPEQFLDWEKTQELRYEYVNGTAIAMAGGTIAHNDLAVSLLLLLAPHVRSSGCKINVSDVKVQIRRRYRYPDLVVTCDDRDKMATTLFRYPKVIVEVLSPGTESTDRGRKLREYQSIETLQEYVLVSPNEVIIEVYRRNLDGTWQYIDYEAGSQFRLESLGFGCAIDEIYESITLDELMEEPFNL
ncbi:MAG: Uma2 family endonuclease [Synechococcales cyanobacterium CRU_2_2]|nr:Uma2 family endonuclease [Synechococcales cyanobacterium CRU_2_2]